MDATANQVRPRSPAHATGVRCPYVKWGTSDPVGAELICAAATRPKMRFVEAASEGQEFRPSTHGGRDVMVRQCT